MKARQGFTLIELLIAVAVVAILVTIAYPSYNGYLARSRRADAQQLMMQMDNRQKQILLEQRAYATAFDALNLAGGGWTCSAASCVNPYYTITFDPAVDNAATPPSYTICAVPVAGSSQADDGTLTLDSTRAKQRRTGTSCASGADLGW